MCIYPTTNAVSWAKIIEGGAEANVPLVVELAVWNLELEQERPYLSVCPVNDRIDSLKSRPSGIGRVSKRQSG